MADSAVREYRVSRPAVLKATGAILLVTLVFTAGWLFFPPSPSSGFSTRQFHSLAPWLALCGVVVLVYQGALAFRGPYRVTTEGFVNPEAWSRSCNEVSWGDVTHIQSGPGRRLSVRLRSGRTSRIALVFVEDPSGFERDMRTSLRKWRERA